RRGRAIGPPSHRPVVPRESRRLRSPESRPTLQNVERRCGRGGGMARVGMGNWPAAELADVLRVDLGRGIGGKLMAGPTVDACLALLAASDLTIVDLDGPPPELHPRFR